VPHEKKPKAEEAASPVADLRSFLGANKRWWLAPLLLVFGIFVLLVLITFFGKERVVETGLGAVPHRIETMT